MSIGTVPACPALAGENNFRALLAPQCLSQRQREYAFHCAAPAPDFDMHFKITKPAVWGNAVLFQPPCITADSSDNIFQRNTCPVFFFQQRPVKRSRHYLAAQVSGMKANPFFIAESNKLDMKGQESPRLHQLFQQNPAQSIRPSARQTCPHSPPCRYEKKR